MVPDAVSVPENVLLSVKVRVPSRIAGSLEMLAPVAFADCRAFASSSRSALRTLSTSVKRAFEWPLLYDLSGTMPQVLGSAFRP